MLNPDSNQDSQRRSAPLLRLLAFAALVVIFGFGLQRLCAYRFQRGDIYPPLSSYRVDPLGLKVLYDALSESGNYEPRRNLRPLEKLGTGQGEPFTLVYAGVDPHGTTADWSALARLVLAGNRVAIAFEPVRSDFKRAQPKKESEGDEKMSAPKKEEQAGENKPEKEEKPRETPNPEETSNWSETLKRFGIHVRIEKEWLEGNAAPKQPPRPGKPPPPRRRAAAWKMMKKRATARSPASPAPRPSRPRPRR